MSRMSLARVRPQGRRAMLGVALVGVMGMVITACGSGTTSTEALDEPVAADPVVLDYSVDDGDTGVSVIDDVTITAEDGTLQWVSMTNSEGTEVPSVLSADKTEWRSDSDLRYGMTYTITTRAQGESGPVEETIDFTTVAPTNLTAAYMLPSGGASVGVGQSAVVQFDEAISDRQADQDAITVTADPPVEGAFYWKDNREVRWRPKDYWQPGTSVEVEVDIYGKDLGNGMYGEKDTSASFVIGDEVIAVADDLTKTITVSRNGEVIKTMPTSMGKAGYDTPVGVYTVGESYESMIMDSSTYGVPTDAAEGYRTPVDHAVRMSYSGIFVHSAPWSVWAQGSQNTSHGCLNVSPADAAWFYNNLGRGDLVIVKNTGGSPLPGYDGLGDWQVPWETWKAGNADV